LAFQVAIAQLEMPDTDYAYRVRYYIQRLEYSVNMLPIPDITFVLNVDVATSEKMVAERYKNTSTLKDKHEANTKLLELSHQIYRKMTSDAPETYLEIICNNEDGTIRSREDIHAEILSIVKNKQVPATKGFFGIA
jgi:thymidylate kinase